MAIPFVATGKTNPNDSEIPMQYYLLTVHRGT
jgi:hypothetical protein